MPPIGSYATLKLIYIENYSLKNRNSETDSEVNKNTLTLPFVKQHSMDLLFGPTKLLYWFPLFVDNYIKHA